MQKVKTIEMEKLIDHPENANRQKKFIFDKLVGNIQKTGRYQPLIVRPAPKKKGKFQIINGHHRKRALQKIGRKKADCIIWNLTDHQADLLLMSLNSLTGSDDVTQKRHLLKKLTEQMNASELSNFIPETKSQIEKLVSMNRISLAEPRAPESQLSPVVFFVTAGQKNRIESALDKTDIDDDSDRYCSKKTDKLMNIIDSYLTEAN